MWLIATLVLVLVFLVRFKTSSQFKGLSLWQHLFHRSEMHKMVTALRHEKFVSVKTLLYNFVVATDPDSAKFVLSNQEDFPKAPRRGSSDKFAAMSTNILFTNGEKWRQYRTVLSPPFHFDVVRQWIPEFHQLSIDLMNLWKPLMNMGSIDLMHWMPLFTLDVLGTTVLSRSFNAMQGKADKELIAVNTILQTGQKPSTVAKAIAEKITGKPFLKELYDSLDTIQNFIAEDIKTHKAGKVADGKFSLIDVMLKTHDPNWKEEEVIANAFVLFVAGHETTATALAWLLYHIALNKHVQDKAIEEVKTVLGGKPITAETLKQLPYLNNVIKENMRMQPPLAMTTTAHAEREVQYEGKTIPKGARVGVSIYAIHHSPELWENPEEFNPARFEKPTVPFSYLPFSLKSRACLGNQFSLVEQLVFFATFLQHFRTETVTAFKPASNNHPTFNTPQEVKDTYSSPRETSSYKLRLSYYGNAQFGRPVFNFDNLFVATTAQHIKP